jgi:arylsulfatase A-like enzyme
VLSDAGYATAAFTGGGQLDAVFQLDQGFDEYHHFTGNSFARAVDESLDMLRNAGEEPFFVFLHTYEVHHPYRPDPAHLAIFESGYAGQLPNHIEIELLEQINAGERNADAADLAHIVATYDAGIRSVDGEFRRLIDWLKTEGLYEDTLILLTSDHGEEFSEHGKMGWHSHTLYDELLRVPLAIKLPGQRLAGTRVAELVRGIDVAPSILAELALPSPSEWDGVDLLERIESRPTEPLVAISALDGGGVNDSSIRTDRWKLIRTQVFDLKQDPSEAQPVADEKVGTRLRGQLQETVSMKPMHGSDTTEIEQSTLEALESLGYVVPDDS